jgi:hypothetical protein
MAAAHAKSLAATDQTRMNSAVTQADMRQRVENGHFGHTVPAVVGAQRLLMLVSSITSWMPGTRPATSSAFSASVMSATVAPQVRHALLDLHV